MICWDCYCFTAGSWRFAGLNCASSVVASYISNVQPHLLLFAASRECLCCCRWCGVLGVSVSPTATLRHTQCLVLWYFSFLFICGGGMSVVSCKVERWKRKRAQVTYKMDHASIVTILYFFWKKVFIYLFSKAFFGLFFIYEYIKLTVALPVTLLNILGNISDSVVFWHLLLYLTTLLKASSSYLCRVSLRRTTFCGYANGLGLPRSLSSVVKRWKEQLGDNFKPAEVWAYSEKVIIFQLNQFSRPTVLHKH